MWLVLAGSWLVAVVLTLAVCRAAGRADEQAERRARTLVESGKRTSTIGLVAAATAIGATCGAPEAEARSCASPASDAAPADLAAAVGCRITNLRVARGLDPLSSQRQLRVSARRYAEDMAERDFFSHVSPDGSRLRDRLLASGYVDERCSWHVGEVLAWGSGTDADAGWVVRAWMHSPPHRRVLLGDDFTDLGVGIAAGAPVETPSDVPALTAAALLGHRHCPA
jgi:uncharacterized protein YkwD